MAIAASSIFSVGYVASTVSAQSLLGSGIKPGVAVNLPAPKPITHCTSQPVKQAIRSGGSYVFACSGTISINTEMIVPTHKFVSLNGHGRNIRLVGLRLVVFGTLDLAHLTLTGGRVMGTPGRAGIPGANGMPGNPGKNTSGGAHSDAGNGGNGTPGADGHNGTNGHEAGGGTLFLEAGSRTTFQTVTITGSVAYGGNAGSGGNGGSGGGGGVGGGSSDVHRGHISSPAKRIPSG